MSLLTPYGHMSRIKSKLQFETDAKGFVQNTVTLYDVPMSLSHDASFEHSLTTNCWWDLFLLLSFSPTSQCEYLIIESVTPV